MVNIYIKKTIEKTLAVSNVRNQQEFKQTEIGRLPKEWEVKKVIELFDVETGTTPSTKQKEYWNEGNINWITPSDMSKLNGRIYIQDSGRKITERGLKGSNLTLLPPRSIVVSSRAPVGYIAITKRNATFNQGCKGLIPKNVNKISSEFYAYYFLNKKIELENLSGGSTFKELSKERLENFCLPVPFLPEQKKIAEILSTVDQAIEKVDEAIKRTQKLKNGLMQELLTKGIGHKEFKKTEVGRIPKEWEIVKISELGKIITGGTPSTSNNTYWNGSIPFITPADIKGDKYVYQTERYITSEGARKIGFILPTNTVLVVCIGSTIGKTGVTYGETVINQQINSIICDEKVNKDYVYYAVTFRANHLKSFSGIAAVPIIKKSLFEQFKIPLPPLSEQEKIAEILSAVDERLELFRKRKERLEKIKKGLMNDLLTGRVRVKG